MCQTININHRKIKEERWREENNNAFKFGLIFSFSFYFFSPFCASLYMCIIFCFNLFSACVIIVELSWCHDNIWWKVAALLNFCTCFMHD
jgi:hypothetical protein